MYQKRQVKKLRCWVSFLKVLTFQHGHLFFCSCSCSYSCWLILYYLCRSLALISHCNRHSLESCTVVSAGAYTHGHFFFAVSFQNHRCLIHHWMVQIQYHFRHTFFFCDIFNKLSRNDDSNVHCQ